MDGCREKQKLFAVHTQRSSNGVPVDYKVIIEIQSSDSVYIQYIRTS